MSPRPNSGPVRGDLRRARRSCATLGPLLALAGALLLLAPGLAAAQIGAIQEIAPLDFEEEEEFPFLLYGITIFGGIATYDMGQMNEALRSVNDEIRQQGSFGVQFDTLDRGVAMGAGLRAILAERYFVSADFERTIASTSVGGVTSESKVDIPVDIISGSLGFDFLSARGTRFGFAAGIGWYNSRAEQILTETLSGQDTVTLGKVKLDGSTVSPHYQAFFEAKFTERLFVGLVAGYRTAKVKDVSISGLDDIAEPASDTAFIAIPVAEVDPMDDTKTLLREGGDSLDWSGFFGRATMTFYVNAPAF